MSLLGLSPLCDDLNPALLEGYLMPWQLEGLRLKCEAVGTDAAILSETPKVTPLCPIFGTCGGCAYQHLPYEEELAFKESELHALFHNCLGIHADIFEPIVASPKPYHYRSRLDLTLRKDRHGELILGFQAEGTHQLIATDACAIADKKISEFLPGLKEKAAAIFPPRYRNANLVVRTGDDGRIFWGGIGPGSLDMKSDDYFWTEIEEKKIFYSLGTFFQANLAILPALMRTIREWASFDRGSELFDLYAGVGLFGIFFAPEVGRVVMIEENTDSIELMKFNRSFYQAGHVEILEGKVEAKLPEALAVSTHPKRIALMDPPRRGLSPEVMEVLTGSKRLERLLYLSCNPETLVRDLREFLKRGWCLRRVVPFDFFPKTRHLETLVLLTPHS